MDSDRKVKRISCGRVLLERPGCLVQQNAGYPRDFLGCLRAVSLGIWRTTFLWRLEGFWTLGVGQVRVVEQDDEGVAKQLGTSGQGLDVGRDRSLARKEIKGDGQMFLPLDQCLVQAIQVVQENLLRGRWATSDQLRVLADPAANLPAMHTVNHVLV